MTGWLIYDAHSAARNEWFIGQMQRVAAERGVSLLLRYGERLQIGVGRLEEGAAPTLLRYDGAPIPPPDFVLNRCIFPLLSRALENAGIPVFNSADAAEICNDKRRTHLFLRESGIPMPDSLFLDRRYIDPTTLPPFPYIIKSADGHGGTEVFFVDSPEALSRALASFRSSGILLQRPVSDLGRDMRVYVLGGRIIGAVLRHSDSDFRSNYSLGGQVSLVEPDESVRRAVALVTERLPLTYAGIDFIFDRGKPLLNEIEDIVGARMLYALTHRDICREYLDCVLSSLSR